MAGLYDALLETRAVITELHTPRVCRVTHGDASITVDCADEISLVLNLTEAHRATRWANGCRTTAQRQAGAVTLIPPSCPTELRLDGTATVLILRLSWAELSGWGSEEHGLDPCQVELQPRFAFHDPVLAWWLYGAAAGAQDEGEALRAIVERLLRAHASRPAPASSLRFGGLSPVRLRRVQERIEADLDQALTLVDLAAEAQTSVFHFAREFRRTMGTPPHQYLLRRRLARAVALLTDPGLPIADVAAAAGFSHASHLARHMRRRTGLAPDAFRSSILFR